MTADASKRRWSDRSRQAANLGLAVAMPVVTFLCFSLGTGFDEATGSGVGDPPIIPAGYTFIIWSVIYAGAIAYGIVQALPSRREDPRLRRIGAFTSSAFLGTSIWLVMARLGLIWATVACIACMMASLAVVLAIFARDVKPRTPVERWLVVAPLSLFAGYVTAAAFANTAAAMKGSGLMTPGASETGWSISLIVAAGAVAAWATRAMRGNAAYALAIIWALLGIVVANTFERARNAPVAIAAGSAAIVVAASLAWTRLSRRPTSASGMGTPTTPNVDRSASPQEPDEALGRGDAGPRNTQRFDEAA